MTCKTRQITNLIYWEKGGVLHCITAILKYLAPPPPPLSQHFVVSWQNWYVMWYLSCELHQNCTTGNSLLGKALQSSLWRITWHKAPPWHSPAGCSDLLLPSPQFVRPWGRFQSPIPNIIFDHLEKENKVEDSIMLFKANKMSDKEGEGGLENT